MTGKAGVMRRRAFLWRKDALSREIPRETP
jgi:hypothetical protein